jgi:RNA polymerase sigma-70 factor (ECF subfamily)
VDAEEVVQETFVRLWESGPDAAADVDARTVLAWLYRTCTRLAIDVLRRRRRHPVLADEGEDGDDAAAGPALEEVIAAKRLVLTLCEQVPVEQLEAAVLCRVDGLSQPEAARVLGISERTVRRLLERLDERMVDWRKEYAS